MITIYTLTYNEELLIQFMIDHYKSRFHDCHIIIYDNSSTDNTVSIARSNGCEIRTYDSNNSLDDGLHMNMKSNCWRDANTDWVLVQDLDELLDINDEQLKIEESLGTTIIKPEAWTMVNLDDNYDIKNMKYGFRDPIYDKSVLFNKKHISNINYDAGCHGCAPTGNVKFNDKKYIMYHYRDINPNHTVKKNKLTAQRLSAKNRLYNWGYQALRSEDELRKDFERLKGIAILVPQKK